MAEAARRPERPIFHVETWSPYEGRWDVQPVADETEAGVANARRIARVPLGETTVQRHIRLHEAHHALHSPPDPTDGSFLRRMVEELRVNALAHDAGVDVHLQHETCYDHWSLPIPTEPHDQLVWWLQFAASTWAHEALTEGAFGPEHEHADISPGHRTWLRALVESMAPATRELAAEASRRILAQPGSLLAADNTAAWLERELRVQLNSTADMPSEYRRAYCSCNHHRDRDCAHYDPNRSRQRKPFYDCRRENHRDDDPQCPVHHPPDAPALSDLFPQDAQSPTGGAPRPQAPPSPRDDQGEQSEAPEAQDGPQGGPGGGSGAGTPQTPATPPEAPSSPPQPGDDDQGEGEGSDGGGADEQPGDEPEPQGDDQSDPEPGEGEGAPEPAPQPQAPPIGVRVLPAPSYAPQSGPQVAVTQGGEIDSALTAMAKTEAEQRAEAMRQAPPPDAWQPSTPGSEKHATRALEKISRAQDAEAARHRRADTEQRVSRGGGGTANTEHRVTARIGKVEVHDHLPATVRTEVRAMPTGLRTRGTEIRSVERWWTDGAIFKKNRPGGSIAIDVSGSMSWDWDALRDAIRELPATTVATYSQSNLPSIHAAICVVARAGRWRDPHPVMRECKYGDYNGADLEVLTWIARQPEPRIILGDFEIHSGSIYTRMRAAKAAGQTWRQFRAGLIAEIRATMRQHRIVRCQDVKTALEVVRRHGRVTGMRDVWQWNSRGLFDGTDDGEALSHFEHQYSYAENART